MCSNCAMRLFNKKHYNLQGIGNPYFGNLIVVPNVDYNAYKTGSMAFSEQVEIIKSIISSTGELDDVYILPLIRCNVNIGCELNDDIYNNCMSYFIEDLRKYQFKHVLYLGEAAKKFIGDNIKNNLETTVINTNETSFNVNYSPFVKYTNDKLYETFKHYIIKWINFVRHNYYTYNKIIHL